MRLSPKKRESCLTARKAYTLSGADLRAFRKEVLALSYDELADLSVEPKERNKRMLKLVEQLVADGIYATSAGFSMKNPGSHAEIRWSIGRAMWREWIVRENKRLKAAGEKRMITTRDWQTWFSWARQHGWDMTSRTFVKPSN